MARTLAGSTRTRSVTQTKAKRHYSGPAEWLMPQLEEAYSKLQPKEQAEAEAAAPVAAAPVSGFRSTIHDGRDEWVLADLGPNYWQEQFEAYHRRRLEAHRAALPARAPVMDIGPAMPAIPGQNNWTPLGPAIVARGQTVDRRAVSGRVPGIAVAPGGSRVYVATANGGVWRSDDAGR